VVVCAYQRKNVFVCISICICSCPEFFDCLCCESTELRHQSVGKVMKAGKFLYLGISSVCSVFES